MKSPLRSGVFLLVVLPGLIWPQNAVPKKGADALNRTTPRSAVTSFLQACDSQNYDQAAHYLDLRNVPERVRAAEGPELSKELELALNSNSHFDVLRLSDKPEGNLADDPNPQLEHITTITRNVGKIAIDLNQVTEGGSQVWLFSPATVAAIPTLATTSTPSSLENHLPHFLVATLLLETPLWKWAALVILAVIILSLLRLAGHLVVFLVGKFFPQFATSHRWLWVQAVVGPSLVFLSAITFALGEQFIDPSALSRLYIARVLLLVVVFSFSWCLINLVDLFLTRIDSFLDPRQRIVSHSLIHLGRRTSKFAICVVALIIVLDNWGYNMSTMIAGLGVGGIAIALAAQSTIANVFGGVSVIGDRPVLLGDFGNFGGIIGTVEDIGMRSTRVRTLNRTLMSIPNSSFAGMNLENYAARDKILFNPTLQIKRATPKDKLRQSMNELEEFLKTDKKLEVGPTPIRISGLTAPSFAVEIFAYVLTPDINEFYKIEADLFIKIDDVLTANGVELT
jgi:MscS family membrane protein